MLSGEFSNSRGTSIYTTHWKAKTAGNSGILILHGYAEHSGRYRHVAKYFNESGHHVFALDYEGHGKSGGKKGLILDWRNIVSDIELFFDQIRNENPEITRWFLLGHSTGGAFAYLTAEKHQRDLAGIMLSAPLIAPAFQPSSLLVSIGRILGKVFPTLPMVPFDVDAQCRDSEVIKLFRDDPNAYTGKLRAGTGLQFMDLCDYMQNTFKPENIQIPVWAGHSSTDRLTSFSASKAFFNRISSGDKTFQKYDGLFHELLNEPEHRIILGTLSSWLRKRV